MFLFMLSSKTPFPHHCPQKSKFWASISWPFIFKQVGKMAEWLSLISEEQIYSNCATEMKLT